LLEDLDTGDGVRWRTRNGRRTDRFLRPDVPGFWPSKGFVGTSETGKDMMCGGLERAGHVHESMVYIGLDDVSHQSSFPPTFYGWRGHS
jgi:hypothetical protein